MRSGLSLSFLKLPSEEMCHESALNFAKYKAAVRRNQSMKTNLGQLLQAIATLDEAASKAPLNRMDHVTAQNCVTLFADNAAGVVGGGEQDSSGCAR